MRTDYITPEAWAQVAKRYPGAYHILLRSSLETEKKVAQQELSRQNLDPRRRQWLTERLTELTQFDEK